MANSTHKIYARLPPNVVPEFAALPNREPIVKNFLTRLLPAREHDAIDSTLQRVMPLVSLRKPKTKPRRTKGTLSLSERRRLGLYQLQKHGSQYTDARPVHTLWLQYISGLLCLSDLEKKGFTADSSDKQWAQVSQSLYRADYHGAEVEVTRTTCSTLRGIKGIVLMDTKNTFKIISQDNVIRTVPKAPCVFTLHLKGYKCTLLGKYFCARPAERAVKKVKSICPFDL